jgi:hydroxysqualene dehydroxylase
MDQQLASLGEHGPPQPTDSAAHIAVVGGGYSGMAAAVQVVQRGGRVSVFEAARVLGGRARRIEYQDRTLDNGQHILSGAYRELLRLMDVVGVSARAYERVPLHLEIAPQFRLAAPLLPAPLHMAAALLFARGLTLLDRWRAIQFMHRLKRNQFQVDPSVTVADLLAIHKQPVNVVDYLWRPLTVSALNTPIERASAQVFANVLRDALAGEREASDLLLPKVDLTSLFPEPAANWLTARGCQTAVASNVTAIAERDNAVEMLVNGQARQFDAVIVAVGPHQRAALGLPQAMPEPAYEPIVTIYFGFEHADSLPVPMLGQRVGITQWFFDRRALSHAPRSSELVIAAVISASGVHDALSQNELAAAVLAELRQHLPLLPEPTWQKSIREKFATFACTPSAPRPAMVTTSRRLYLAGDDVVNPERQYPATLEGAVRNGIAAANAACDALFELRSK